MMTNILLQIGGVQLAEQWQQQLAWVLVVVFIFVSYRIFTELEKAGKEEHHSKHSQALKESQDESDKSYTQIFKHEDVESRLRGLFDDRDDETVNTFRSALTNVIGSIRMPKSIHSIPKRLIAEGGIYIILGTVLVTSAETARKSLSTSPEISINLDKILSFSLNSPIFKSVWELVFTGFVLLSTLLYENYILVGILSILIGIVVIILQQINSEDVPYNISEYKPSRIYVLGYLVMGVVGSWFFAVVSYQLLSEVTNLASVIATVQTATFILIWFSVGCYTAIQSRFVLINKTKDSDFDGNPTFIAVYIALNWVARVTSVVLVPLIIIYLVKVISSGRITEYYNVFLSESTIFQVSVGLVATILFGVFIYNIILSLEDAKLALVKAIQYYSLKTKFITSAIPLIFMGALYLSLLQVLAGTDNRVLIAAPIAIFAGVVGRYTIIIGRKTKRRVSMFNSPSSRRVVTVDGYWVTDAAGRNYPIIELNSEKKLMGSVDDIDSLVEDAEKAIESYYQDSSYQMTISEYHYDRAFDNGIPSYERSRKAMQNEAEEAILYHLMRQKNLIAEQNEVNELKESIAPSVFESVIQSLQHQRKVRKVRDKYVLVDESQINEGFIDKIVYRLGI